MRFVLNRRKEDATEEVKDALKEVRTKEGIILAGKSVLRDLKWKVDKEGVSRETPFENHTSYPIAAGIQIKGEVNEEPCGSCSKGAGPFEGGCISASAEEKKLFKGVCGNCFWGGQGIRCTVREGGAATKKRVPALQLLWDSNRVRSHIGSKHNLDDLEGCMNARGELLGLVRSLEKRIKSIEAEEEVSDIDSEKASDEE